MAGFVRVIWGGGEEVYFYGQDWTGQITLKLLGKIGFSRKIDFLARQLFSHEQKRATRSMADFRTGRPRAAAH
jgi:hypothetical protein